MADKAKPGAASAAPGCKRDPSVAGGEPTYTVELVAGWFRRWLGASTIRQRDAARRERDAEREARAASATSFAFTIAARGLADHPWQEYNAYGYLCHYPGCQLTPDEHAEFVPRLTPFASGGPVRGPGSRDDDRAPFQPAGCLHSEICRECRAE